MRFANYVYNSQAIECVLNHEIDVAKVLLRDYVNATKEKERGT